MCCFYCASQTVRSHTIQIFLPIFFFRARSVCAVARLAVVASSRPLAEDHRANPRSTKQKPSLRCASTLCTIFFYFSEADYSPYWIVFYATIFYRLYWLASWQDKAPICRSKLKKIARPPGGEEIFLVSRVFFSCLSALLCLLLWRGKSVEAKKWLPWIRA